MAFEPCMWQRLETVWALRQRNCPPRRTRTFAPSRFPLTGPCEPYGLGPGLLTGIGVPEQRPQIPAPRVETHTCGCPNARVRRPGTTWERGIFSRSYDQAGLAGVIMRLRACKLDSCETKRDSCGTLDWTSGSRSPTRLFGNAGNAGEALDGAGA